MSFRRELSKEITGTLTIKIALILLAGFTLFGAQNRVHVDTEKITAKIFGQE